MVSVSLSILIGVLSGVLASSLIWIISQLFNKVFIPWYQNLIYKGMIVSGTWESQYHTRSRGGIKKTIDYELSITLNQKGHNIDGLFSARKKDEGNISTRNYKIQGIIFDNYLIVTYLPSDRKFTGGGSFVLKVINGGNQLEGGISFIDQKTTNVFTDENILWNRIN